MAGLSDYAENKLLNHMLNGITWTSPASVYVALYTAAPSDAGGGTEVTGNAYARVLMTAGWTVAAGLAKNTGTVTFPTPTGAGWGTVTHVGIFDASSGGNLLLWAALQAAKPIAAGDTVRYTANQLQVSAD